MQYLKNSNLTNLILIVIIAIGAFFRFYKLDWGNGIFPHPDEYHIVISVNQLSFPQQMNPHFFSYGTVTIYLIYFTKSFLNFLSSVFNFNFLSLSPFLIGRFYSALFSSLTIPIVYLICTLFLKKEWALVASFLIATTPGLIQQAHFATPESALIFFILSSLFFLLKFVQSKTLQPFILSSIFWGFSLGVKISSAIFIATLLLAIFLKLKRSPQKIVIYSGIFFAISLATLFIVAPFIFLDFNDFLASLRYEGGLAAGKFIVFYTRQFINTTPFLFQLEKILPYALGPALLISGLGGFTLMAFLSFKEKRVSSFYLLIISCYLTLLISSSLLFAKWTRFAAPTFPFFAIFSAFLFAKLPKETKLINLSILIIVIFSTFAWSLAFFSLYLKPDVRITASAWLEKNAPLGSVFLVEGGNTVDIPLKGNFQIISLDFYNLEDDPVTHQKIAQAIAQADYFLLESRRVFANHQRLPEYFPKTAQFYNLLFNGHLGFSKIAEFSSYPGFKFGNLNFEIPDEQAEETWSVFDHPVIRVFQKNQQLPKLEYNQLLVN